MLLFIRLQRKHLEMMTESNLHHPVVTVNRDMDVDTPEKKKELCSEIFSFVSRVISK